MTSRVFNIYKYLQMTSEVYLGDALGSGSFSNHANCMLIDDTSTVDTENADINTLSDFTTLGMVPESIRELTGSRLVRNDPSLRVEWHADSIPEYEPIFYNVTIIGILFYLDLDEGDTTGTAGGDGIPILFIQFTSPIPMFGQELVLPFSDSGIMVAT